MYGKKVGWYILEQLATIKGTKAGIILVLDPSADFETLCDAIAKRFKDASSFLGKNDMGLIIRGRELSDEEGEQVISIIEANSDITINCIRDEGSAFEETVTKEAPVESTEAFEDAFDSENVTFSDKDAVIYRGNLRSGQDISSPKSIVVLGDVKPGANVTSGGSIFILGELRGNACAGDRGDDSAIIMALKLSPIQIRIGDVIAISPDADKGAKLKVRKKKFMAGDREPEVAYIENGHIVKSTYDASFLRRFYKI